MMLLGLVIAGLAAYWVYKDAIERGHDLNSAILWAVGTFAILIVFLPLYLIFGRNPKTPRRPEPIIDIEGCPVEDITDCTMCGAKIKRDFKACPYCGHTVNPTCTQCGHMLEREWRVCPYCQTPTPVK